jgi:hypothetical protein
LYLEDKSLDEIVLYATEACHLCDLAVVEIEQALCAYPEGRITYVDIAESDELIARYGEQIPVLANPARSEELFWPFTCDEVKLWLASQWKNV